LDLSKYEIPNVILFDQCTWQTNKQSSKRQRRLPNNAAWSAWTWSNRCSGLSRCSDQSAGTRAQVQSQPQSQSQAEALAQDLAKTLAESEERASAGERSAANRRLILRADQQQSQQQPHPQPQTPNNQTTKHRTTEEKLFCMLSTCDGTMELRMACLP